MTYLRSTEVYFLSPVYYCCVHCDHKLCSLIFICAEHVFLTFVELKHLFEGDIAGDVSIQRVCVEIMFVRNLKAYSQCFPCVLQPSRNAILDESRRWKFPIPYILTDSLGTQCTNECN